MKRKLAALVSLVFLCVSLDGLCVEKENGETSDTDEINPLSDTSQRYYDRETALGLSFGFMAVPMVLGGGMLALGGGLTNYGLMIGGSVLGGLGLTFGPSAGYFYVGRVAHAFGWSFTRVAMAWATVLLSFAVFLFEVTDGSSSERRPRPPCEGEECSYQNNNSADSDSNNTALVFVIVIGSAITLTAAIIDAAKVGGAADLANEKRKKTDVTLIPAPVATSTGQAVPGLVLTGTF